MTYTSHRRCRRIYVAARYTYTERAPHVAICPSRNNQIIDWRGKTAKKKIIKNKTEMGLLVIGFNNFTGPCLSRRENARAILHGSSSTRWCPLAAPGVRRKTVIQATHRVVGWIRTRARVTDSFRRIWHGRTKQQKYTKQNKQYKDE